MNEVSFNSYQEYKQQLNTELHKEAEGFVRIGYLLKVARDTDILKESGYASVFDFASAEYNLSKDVVSRWIAINDRFSKGGYSMELDDRFGSFGPTKLAEMLTLPDAVVDVIPDNITRSDLRDLKNDIKKENKISDLEILAERNEIGEEQEKSLFLQLLLIHLHQEAPDTARFEAVRNIKPVNINNILDVLAPSGKAMVTVRLPGAGTYIVSIRGKDEPITLLNLRGSNEKVKVAWEDVIRDIEQFQSSLLGMDVYTAWEQVYQEDIFPADNAAEIEEASSAAKSQQNEPEELPKSQQEEKSEEPSMNPPELESTSEKQEVVPAQPKVAPAQPEKKKPKPLINEEIAEQQMHVYTVQFRCTAGEYKALQTWASNRQIKLKKLEVR